MYVSPIPDLGTLPKKEITCRCCGKQVFSSDQHPIHTKCIVKHWSKHAKGINNSRCREFKEN